VLGTAATFDVDFAFEADLAVLFACFLTADFLVLLAAVEVLAEAMAAGFGAGVGVVCAANEAAARASVMVKPMMVETVFVIVLSVLFSGSFCFFRFRLLRRFGL
jgi:hypothetical protein